jgi:hypothetical protein
MKFRYLILAVALAAAVPACGGDDDDGGGNTTQGAGENVSTPITAAEGGEVEIGDAALSIPGGALAEDTTITVETIATSGQPDAENLAGLVYDFGPNGTEFVAPATLTLPAVTVPEGKEAVVAWLDESSGTWQNLPSTVNADGSVSADIEHFTLFVIRLNGAVTSDCSFGACGGDLTGTWEVTGICAQAENAFEEVCASATIDADLNLTGSITFNDDGTYESNFTSSATLSYTLPPDCLSMITGGQLPADCTALEEEPDPQDPSDMGTTCTGDPATDGCTCTNQEAPETSTETGTWATDGTTVTMTEEGGDADSTEFCVDGDEARFQTVEEHATLTWVASRK